MITYAQIKHLCEQKGVTVSQCERDCGFSKGSLSKIEKSKPNGKRLQILADYFDVSIDYLMTGEDSNSYYYDRKTAELAQELYQNKDLHMLFDLTRDSSPEELKKFYDMITIMKRNERGDN